jgi:protein SCO1/2
MWRVALCGAGVTVFAANASAQPRSEDPAPVAASAAAEYFTDVALVNQYGQTMRLYTDLIKGRTIVVVPFFTSCASACPLIVRTLATLQTRLGDRLGRDAVLVSLTVDPARDTVDRLRASAEGAGARPGWFFLGGAPANVELALSKFGLRPESPEGHSNLIIVGNEPTGLWKKLFGLADSDAIVRAVEGVLDDTGKDGR